MWRAGFGKAEIVPEDYASGRYFMSGYGSNKKVDGMYEPLIVRSAALSGGGFTAIFTVFDLTGMTYPDTRAIRDAIKRAVPGVDEVCVSFTHSHAAIDTMGLWGDAENLVSGRFPDYIALCAERAVLSAEAAAADMRRGQLFFGQTEVRGVLFDPRPPVVTLPFLSRFRFEPEDGSEGFSILHFNCHPESLGGENTYISPDYPAEMLKVYQNDRHIRAMFVNGCVGGMQTNAQLYDADGNPLCPRENMLEMGRILGKAAGRIEDEACPESLSVITKEVYIPLENKNFVEAAKAGLICERPEYAGDRAGFVKKTEVGIAEIGGLKIALMPGELFPELAVGGFLSDFDCANPGIKPEGTVYQALGLPRGKLFLVFGLTNDEIGYILPENDFFLDSDNPYGANAIDGNGRRHYEETNSVGPKTAGMLLAALAGLTEARGF